jgi:hypothetical protein
MHPAISINSASNLFILRATSGSLDHFSSTPFIRRRINSKSSKTIWWKNASILRLGSKTLNPIAILRWKIIKKTHYLFNQEMAEHCQLLTNLTVIIFKSSSNRLYLQRTSLHALA